MANMSHALANNEALDWAQIIPNRFFLKLDLQIINLAVHMIYGHY
jgi:hypothetical protein